MCTGPRLTPLLLLLLHLTVYHLHTALGTTIANTFANHDESKVNGTIEPKGGTCWSAMVKNGRCTELLNGNSNRDECCANFGVATAWSNEHLDPGALFFWRVLGGGVPCSPCKDSCDDVDCGKDKVCVVKNGIPRCICSPKCGRSDINGKRYSKGAVCGTDGRSYKNVCRLRKRACRFRNTNLAIDYHGTCQSSCDKITCPSGKNCLLDQNMTPHCVKCTRKCPESNPSRRRVCGADGLTYPSTCHLREKACRSGTAIPLAYKGPCKSSATCKKIRCRDRQVCLTDRDAGGTPRCVTCMHRCRAKHMAGPICASNNSTYGSWCHMMQDACSKGFVLNTKYTGKCLNNNLF